MRKAASQRTNVLVTILVLVLFFFLSTTLVRAYSIDSTQPVSTDQDLGDSISGSISISGTEATGTVSNTGGDTVMIGLASYTKADSDIENQTLYTWTQLTVGPGETKELRVGLPCWSQVDLFRIFPEREGQEGSVITSFKGNVRYGQRLIAAVHTQNECGSGEEDPGQTPAPTATPVAVSTPAPTETPAIGGSSPRTDLTDNRSDNLGCSVRDCSGNVVGGSSGVVAGVSTDQAQLPSTGRGLSDIFGYGFALLTVGLLFRRLASSL